MLTETNRGNLIKDIKENVSFDYGDYEPDPTIARYFEGHDWKNPQILIEFLPANRNKFQSVSNLIGNASEHGEYHSFGYCQMEQCVIRCYAGKQHNDREVHGRLLVEHFANKCSQHILRNWNAFLSTMNASLELYEPFSVRDVTIYDPRKATFYYVYEISFYIRTLFTWTDKPEDVPEDVDDVIMEHIEVLRLEDDYMGKI